MALKKKRKKLKIYNDNTDNDKDRGGIRESKKIVESIENKSTLAESYLGYTLHINLLMI